MQWMGRYRAAMFCAFAAGSLSRNARPSGPPDGFGDVHATLAWRMLPNSEVKSLGLKTSCYDLIAFSEQPSVTTWLENARPPGLAFP